MAFNFQENVDIYLRVSDMKQDRSHFVYRVIAMACTMLMSGLTWSNSLEDTHRFRLGMYEQDIDVTGSITKNPLQKIDIDFDKVLGLEDSGTTAFFSYQWRFKEKFDIELYGPSIYLTYGF